MICEICKDEGWVCDHNKAWEGGNSKCCGSPGKPCVCNTANPPWNHFVEVIETTSEEKENLN
jgi:hypothetical protein